MLIEVADTRTSGEDTDPDLPEEEDSGDVFSQIYERNVSSQGIREDPDVDTNYMV
jgi:hypothetical protein